MPYTPREHALALDLELLSGLRRQAVRSWSLAEWRAVLARVPLPHARCLVLVYLHGLGPAAAAERVGQGGRGNVWKFLRQAAAVLRDRLRGSPLADLSDDAGALPAALRAHPSPLRFLEE